MDINYLIQMLENRLNALFLAKDQAFQAGDLERINAVDAEINGVKDTLSKLKLLSGITEAALATQSTVAEVVKSGIEASFSDGTGPSATDPLLQYDISSYAIDPLHQEKIKKILEKIGFMDSVEKIEFYIKRSYAQSPLNGQMVLSACQKYAVDSRLLLALLELDSGFGTLGIGARTFNPGNVGNTGTETRTYPSWEDGVMAVAEWLDRHRHNSATETVSSPVAPALPIETPNPATLQNINYTTTATSTLNVLQENQNATSTQAESATSSLFNEENSANGAENQSATSTENGTETIPSILNGTPEPETGTTTIPSDTASEAPSQPDATTSTSTQPASQLQSRAKGQKIKYG